MIPLNKSPGYEKVALLIGHPIGHSVSPAMHNAAFKELGLPYEYMALDILPKDLELTVNELRSRQDVLGFNITIPYKESVLGLLDRIDSFAEIIGAVNTAKIENNALVGYNTDAKGFIDSLKLEAQTDPQNKTILVIGAGGAARAISVALSEAKSILFAETILSKAEKLAGYIGSISKVEVSACNISDINQYGGFDIIINASPAGMHPNHNQCPVPESIIKKGALVYDLVYNPLETKLLKTAFARGAKTCSGLDMLIRQGAEAFKIWTGKEAPLDIMKKAALEVLQQ
jgi:shikimate dehydrogenase